MATLDEIVASIQDSLQDTAFAREILVPKINTSLQSIAAGVRMPNGEVSPPLPDLYAFGTVNTSITLPYVSLPADYQRNADKFYDSSFYQLASPRGGGYYAFNRFLGQISNKSLAETGSIYLVAVKGTRIYYQGIPAASTVIGLHYYRKPATLALDGDIPEGLPDHLAEDLLKHAVCMKVYGEIEDGQFNRGIGVQQHTAQFFSLMVNLCDFIGPADASPQYYGDGGYVDAGVCD